MKMTRLDKILSLITRSLLIFLFIGYAGSIMMYYHTHEVHGILITHSHPFKKTNKDGSERNHSHTDNQYILLNHFCETSLTDSIYQAPDIPEMPSSFSITGINHYSQPFAVVNISSELLRAPPSC
jgi:hypothetical protein